MYLDTYEKAAAKLKAAEETSDLQIADKETVTTATEAVRYNFSLSNNA